MTDNARIVREMVDRFLGWKLPADFSPDCGIHYAPLPHPNGWPIGTNLLSAPQAQAMLEHVAGPAITELTGAVDSINEILIKHQDALHDVRSELATAKAELARAREDRFKLKWHLSKIAQAPCATSPFADKTHKGCGFCHSCIARAALAPEQKGV